MRTPLNTQWGEPQGACAMLLSIIWAHPGNRGFSRWLELGTNESSRGGWLFMSQRRSKRLNCTELKRQDLTADRSQAGPGNATVEN